MWLVPTQGPIVNRLAEASDERGRKSLQELLTQIRQMLKAARELGVKVAAGYDASAALVHGTNAREIVGLSTTGAAELLGWQEQVGALAAGKFADIIAVRGNPLSDIKQLEHVPFVMKGGAVVKDERNVTR